jgi:REG-2-like HAD superfamily hydrolase
MSEEIDTIMFDVGGTLVDLSPPKEEVFRRVLAKNGFDAPLVDVASAVAKAEKKFDGEGAVVDGMNESPFWKRYDKFVVDRLGFKVDIEALSRELSAEFLKVLDKTESWAEYPDVRPLLEDLTKRDFKLGIISNATDLVDRVLDHLGLAKYFDPIIVSYAVGARKPDRRIFQIAAEKVHSPPNRMLYIGDKLSVDVMGASNAGMNAVLLDRMNVYGDARCLRIRSLSALRTYL